MQQRGNGTAVSEVQQAEEAHLRVRYDLFREGGPEPIARRRRQDLEDADRRFRMYRLTGEHRAPPLSRKERNELRLLRRLSPAEPKRSLSELDDDRFSPFSEEWPASDGNFYPRHSKLRPPDLLGYTVDLLAEDRERLERLGKIEWEKLNPKEVAGETNLAARVAADQLNEAPLAKARICELEERRAVGFQLTALEEGELRDLRERCPKLAAGIDQLDLRYIHYFRRELDIARKAGLSFEAALQQTQDCCLRFRDSSKLLEAPGAAFPEPLYRDR
jgi:hypothetical protein